MKKQNIASNQWDAAGCWMLHAKQSFAIRYQKKKSKIVNRKKNL